MKYRIYYLDQSGTKDTIMEAPDHEAAAKRFFSQRPRHERCWIRVEVKGFAQYSVRDYDAVEFMDESTRASLPPVPPPETSSAGMPAMDIKKLLQRNPTIKKMLVATSFAFVIGLFLGGISCVLSRIEMTAYKRVAVVMIGALLGSTILSAIALYFSAIIICALKGKPIFVAIGLIALFLPLFSRFPSGILILPVIGAIRIAKPTSSWACKYYGDEKMKIACDRFRKPLATETK